MILLTGSNAYTLDYEHKNGWNADAFKERYSEVLERYDYIVGDWGYNQLRLRGFYQEGHPRATKETTISSLVDYLNEYCNFGCAYFVLRKTDSRTAPTEPEPDDPSTAAASGEAAAQAAETAAAAAAASQNGILMRWPLKERPGGPVRLPGAAAVARAAAEAERRQLQQSQTAATNGKSPESRSTSTTASDYFGGKPGNRSAASGSSERRSYGGSSYAGQADNRNGGRSGQGGRGPRQHNGDRHFGSGSAEAKAGSQQRQSPPEPNRATEPARDQEAAKNGSRWPGKNRKKGRFGGKPNRPDSATRDGSHADRQAGD